MFNLRQQTINVNRLALIESLKENLKTYEIQYAQAVIDYRERLESDLKQALKELKKGDKYLFDIRVNPVAPTNHASKYEDAICMLTHSVDEVINIDTQAFKAYMLNEWEWSEGFTKLVSSYKVAGSMLK